MRGWTRSTGFIATLVILAVTGLCIAIVLPLVHARKVECSAKGGDLISVGKGYLCVSPDGRVIR